VTNSDANQQILGHPALRRRCLAFLGAALIVAACGMSQPTLGQGTAAAPTRLTLAASHFDALPGWSDDTVAAAVPAFLKSCARFAKQPLTAPIDSNARGADFGRVGDWQPLCNQARYLPPNDDLAARRFFEANFTPALVGNGGDSNGLFTGYYETELKASRQRQGAFQTPVYRRPPDLVPGHPYLERGAIEDGALAGRGLELIWLSSPDDLYVLQTQGSGRVHLTDGTVERLVYDTNNARKPVNIEQKLLDRGDIPAAQFSQKAVRAWMREHPMQAKALRRENPHFVFFREHTGAGPLGAQGAVLTPERSLAVDQKFVPLGVPLWLSAQDKYRPAVSLRRLVVAQDTGDGIEGPVRGDFYWGTGAEALSRGGDFYASGQYFVMLPKDIARRVLASR